MTRESETTRGTREETPLDEDSGTPDGGEILISSRRVRRCRWSQAGCGGAEALCKGGDSTFSPTSAKEKALWEHEEIKKRVVVRLASCRGAMVSKEGRTADLFP